MDKLSHFPMPVPGGEPEPPSGIEIPVEVRQALGALALAVNHGLTAEQLRVYAVTLHDVPLHLLRRACFKLANTSHFFPKCAELRECADELARDDAEAQAEAALRPILPPPLSEEREPRYLCPLCLDEPSGWRSFWCRGSGEQFVRELPHYVEVGRMAPEPCGRTKAHGPHAYVVKCSCAAINPVSAEARKRMTVVRMRRQSARRSGSVRDNKSHAAGVE